MCIRDSPCYGCWDRFLGVDPEVELSLEGVGGEAPTPKLGEKLSVVQKARLSRQRQARLDQLPEASLYLVQHAADPRLAGELQVRGDPSSLMMI